MRKKNVLDFQNISNDIQVHWIVCNMYGSIKREKYDGSKNNNKISSPFIVLYSYLKIILQIRIIFEYFYQEKENKEA